MDEMRDISDVYTQLNEALAEESHAQSIVNVRTACTGAKLEF